MFFRLMAVLQLWLMFFTITAQADGRMEPEPIFGGEIYLLEVGNKSKPTLVLVHGLGDGASNHWQEAIASLRSDYHILAFDLPGFGRSSKANTVYSPTRYSKLINHLVGKYAKRPFHLVGHSMGGAIALRYASAYSSDLDSLTLLNAAGILHRMAYTKYLAPLGLEMFAGGPVPARASISDLAGILLGTVERNLPFDMSIVLHSALLRSKLLKGNPSVIAGLGLVLEDYSDALESVQVPTLIIWGEDDQVAPLRTGLVLDALIPHSSLHIIADTGHVPKGGQLQEYLHLVKQHLHSPGSLVSTRAPVLADEDRNEVVCENQHNLIYSGKIKRLVLKNCLDILIRNAEIEELVIKHSYVTIENTLIHGEDTGILAKYSTVMLTAGRIEADVAIKSFSSIFDIAGTRLYAQSNLIKAVGDSDIIMSLVPVESPNLTGRMIHGPQPIQSTLTL